MKEGVIVTNSGCGKKPLYHPAGEGEKKCYFRIKIHKKSKFQLKNICFITNRILNKTKS